MKQALKQSFTLYFEQFKKIAIIGLLFTLPIQLVYTFFINIATAPYQYFGLPFWTAVIQVFTILILFPIIQIPYVSIVKENERDEDITYKRMAKDFFETSPTIYLAAIGCALLSAFGFMLFIIPGIILVIISVALPQVAVLRRLKGKSLWKALFTFGKNRFLPILLTVCLYIVLDYIISGTFFFLSVGLTSSFFIINFIILLTTTLIVPLFIFHLTYLYVEWEKERLEAKGFIEETFVSQS